MNQKSPGPVTEVLEAWNQGKTDAENRVFQETYLELRRLARGLLSSERADHTLQPTALIHEAYLRLSSRQNRKFQDRKHFFAIAAQAMRRVLIDHARKRLFQKRGQGAKALPLETAKLLPQMRCRELVALDDALRGLQGVDPFKAQLVELRFFGGFSIPETARILDSSHATIERHWRLAQGWLYREMDPEHRPRGRTSKHSPA